MLSEHKREEQQKVRSCLLKIISALKLCARQGIAVRDLEDKDGNFWQILYLLAKHDLSLSEWLKRRNHWCSPAIQNEILDLMSHTLLRGICKDAVDSGSFAVIVDGTQDVSGIDQHAVCIRYTDENLEPREEFLGMYAMTSTTGERVANMVEDVLCRLQLPVEMLRGQTYDGAANMSGQYKGAQAIVKEKPSLAIYTHCTAHLSNLVAAAVAKSSSTVRSGMDTVNELGMMLSNSGKLRTSLKEELSAASFNSNTSVIKPLCPTRFLARVHSIQSTLDKYDAVILAVDEYKARNSTAYGVLDRLTKGSNILGMFMAVEIFGQLENLNSSLQGKQQTVSGARAAVKLVIASLSDMHSDCAFNAIYEGAAKFIEDHKADKICLPRRRNIPKISEEDIFQFYKVEFFEVIDTAVNQLNTHFFNLEIDRYASVENILLQDDSTEDYTHLKDYKEFDIGLFQLQLGMFRAQFSYKTVSEAANELRKMTPEVRRLFKEVERLVRLLTIPASTCEAERSFSALRRLKNYMCSTVGQQRLNSVCVCYVHGHILETVNDEDILRQFIAGNDSRINTFGRAE